MEVPPKKIRGDILLSKSMHNVFSSQEHVLKLTSFWIYLLKWLPHFLAVCVCDFGQALSLFCASVSSPVTWG